MHFAWCTAGRHSYTCWLFYFFSFLFLTLGKAYVCSKDWEIYSGMGWKVGAEGTTEPQKTQSSHQFIIAKDS